LFEQDLKELTELEEQRGLVRAKDFSFYADKSLIRFDAFPVPHFFSTKKAGNMSYSYGDEEKVEQNKSLIYSRLELEEKEDVVHVVPEHEDKVRWVDYSNAEEGIKADGVITDKQGLALEMAPADCYVLIVTDLELQRLALIHVGRKNINTDIIRETLNKFKTEKEDIRIALNPGIKHCCLKFGFARALYESLFRRGNYMTPGGFFSQLPAKIKFGFEKFELELELETLRKLIQIGIDPSNIYRTGFCTACKTIPGETDYLSFSHRRSEKLDQEEARNLVTAINGVR